jgi:lysophospholipase L1-like esterase
VAVHGLGGDSIETWTHPKSHAFWLKDFLPQQIPDARIMTFGYNAAAAFGRSTSDVIDHAKSLLGSLVDKREEPEVHIGEDPQNTIRELTQWQEKNRPLIFIAHSLGGIVVKQVR